MLRHVLIKDNGAASKIDDVLIEHGGKVEGTMAYNTAFKFQPQSPWDYWVLVFSSYWTRMGLGTNLLLVECTGCI